MKDFSNLHLKWTLILGVSIRVYLLFAAEIELGEYFILSPTSRSWDRLKEASYRWSRGINPFFDDTYAGSPLLIPLATMDDWKVALMFISSDFVNALMLYCIAEAVQRDEPRADERKLESAMEDDWKVIVPDCAAFSPRLLPTLVSALHFLNPFTVVQCVARSGEAFSLTTLLFSTFCCHSGHVTLGAMSLSIYATFFDLNGLGLVIPFAVLSSYCGRRSADKTFDWMPAVSSIVKFTVSFAMCGVGMLTCAYFSLGSWSFLASAFESQILQLSMNPNLGLRWYVFQQIFPAFRHFFVTLLAGHPFLHVLPVSVRLLPLPRSLATVATAIVLIWGIPPSFSTISLVLCLCLMHPRTIFRMKGLPWILLVTFGAVLLIHVANDLWMGFGTANANYVFFQLLAINLGLNCGLLSFIGGHIKRQKALKMAIKKGRSDSGKQK